MIKEYWIDRGYIRNYNCITYGAEETYTNYKEALKAWEHAKAMTTKHEYVEFLVIYFETKEDQEQLNIADSEVKYHYELD